MCIVQSEVDTCVRPLCEDVRTGLTVRRGLVVELITLSNRVSNYVIDFGLFPAVQHIFACLVELILYHIR